MRLHEIPQGMHVDREEDPGFQGLTHIQGGKPLRETEYKISYNSKEFFRIENRLHIF